MSHCFECHADVMAGHCLPFIAHLTARLLLTCVKPLWSPVQTLPAFSGVGCSLLVIVVTLSRHRPDTDTECRCHYVTIRVMDSDVDWRRRAAFSELGLLSRPGAKAHAALVT